MNPDLRAKLENNLSSYKDITAMLSTPEIYSDRTKMKSLNQELTKLEASVKLYQKYLDIEKSISGTKELLIDDDKEMIAIAQDELRKYETELREVEVKIIEATVEKIRMIREMFIWRFVLALAEKRLQYLLEICLKCIQDFQRKINGILK